MNLYQQFIHKSRYARWLEDEQRRENWDETVQRYVNFFEYTLKENNGYVMDPALKQEVYTAILNLEVMPSMRALMTAGPALERENMAGYNCSYIPVDSPRSFDETLYILMNGTGLGFSVEHKYVSQLPRVHPTFELSDTTIVVKDSKEGWATAIKELINLLYAGQIPKFDTTRLRPAGARLKTFGGRASGPGPLEELYHFLVAIFKNAAGRRLNSLECHDIMCKIAEVVVVGGVRRSALISLSDLDDSLMRNAKTGAWWEYNKQRALANNSFVGKGDIDVGTFLNEWTALYESKSGERGIFNRYAANNQVVKIGRREVDWEWGCNPCSEIILRPNQVCNLTEIVVRPNDTSADLIRKAKIAAILGTWQSTLVNFKYLRKRWYDNIAEERLLGVSLTGILDHKDLSKIDGSTISLLRNLKEYVVNINADTANKLGIPQSTATTCIKPSGTVSQLVNAASGIHTRHSEYYIRTVRGDKKDPLTQFLIDQGIPCEDDIHNPSSTCVFSFPISSPKNALTRVDLTAIEHLNLWKMYQDNWCEHKPSVTISVKENEWLDVGAWVYNNYNVLSGISFLPYSDHNYKQAPYQECTKEEYEKLAKSLPENIDWELLQDYEKEDNTVGSQEFACTGGVCEIVDIN